MSTTHASARVLDPQSYPLAPSVSMSWGQRVRAIRAFHTGIEAIREDAGPVALVRLGPRWLAPTWAVVTSPQGARDVLGGTDPATIDKTGVFFDEARRWIGDNVFDLAHQQWLPRRRTLQPIFTKLSVATFAGHMAAGAEELARLWGPGVRVDLSEECRRLTLRVLSRSVLGTDLGDRADDLEPHFKRVMRFVTRRATQPVRLPAAVPSPARWRFRRSLSAVHDVIDDAIAACRADPSRDAPLVRLMLAARDPETGEPLSDAAVRDELFIFLFAGHDTTATTLAYALWSLGRHPEIQQRVAEEVSALGEHTLTVADVPRLTYTVQVLTEALRLCPPAAAVPRTAGTDVVIDGRRIPAGSELAVGVYAMHRDPALWERPLVFDPQRFSPERVKTRDRWQFLPFGGGPQSCIGEHYAMLEATLGLATIVRAATITSENDDFPLALPYTLTADGEIPAIVADRGTTPRR